MRKPSRSFKIPTKRRNGTCFRVFVLQLRDATDMAGKLLSLQPGFPFTYNGKDFIKNYGLTLPREIVNKWLFLFVYFSAFILDTKSKKKKKKVSFNEQM